VAVRVKQEAVPERITSRYKVWTRRGELCVCMSVIRRILAVSRNFSCFCDVSISVHMNPLHCWGWKCLVVNLFFGCRGRVCSKWVDLYVIG
jgi:hypothetical protein